MRAFILHIERKRNLYPHNFCMSSCCFSTLRNIQCWDHVEEGATLERPFCVRRKVKARGGDRLFKSSFNSDSRPLDILQRGELEKVLMVHEVEAGGAGLYQSVCEFREVHTAPAPTLEVNSPSVPGIALQYRGCTWGHPVPGAHFLSGQPSQYNRYLYIFCPHFI